METYKQERICYLKPMDIKREARVPYPTVIYWIEKGHPVAGKLPAIDLSERYGRHSYRVRREDWEEFKRKLQVPPDEH